MYMYHIIACVGKRVCVSWTNKLDKKQDRRHHPPSFFHPPSARRTRKIQGGVLTLELNRKRHVSVSFRPMGGRAGGGGDKQLYMDLLVHYIDGSIEREMVRSVGQSRFAVGMRSNKVGEAR